MGRDLVVREGDQVVALTNPLTGEVVALNEATDQLAVLHDGLADVARQIVVAQQAVEGELLARMDRRGRWTADVDGWRLEAASPNAGTTSYEPEPLRRDLLRLVREGVIDRDLVDDAVPIERPPPRLKVKKAGVNALAKLGGEVAAAVERHEVEVEPPARRVKIKRKGER